MTLKHPLTQTYFQGNTYKSTFEVKVREFVAAKGVFSSHQLTSFIP